MYLLAQETCPLIDDIRLITLTQGKFARVSAEACDRVAEFKRHAALYKKSFYAYRSVRTVIDECVKIRVISMARFLLNLEDGNPLWADHIDGDTLNNIGTNLRSIPEWENKKNRRINSNNTSGFKGVSPLPNGKWAAYIFVNGRNLYLGSYPTPELAYAAYCAAAIKYFGEFARAG